MAKITYLLGAGASADTIPIVSQMHSRIKQIIDELNENLLNLAEDKKEQLNVILDDLKWLIKESENYYSIDTLAKKFYLTNKSTEYYRLKRALVIYFTIEQLSFTKEFIYPKNHEESNYLFSKRHIDKRYDSFIATIANRSGNNFILNDNIKMLSWNYDLQVELSLKRFTNKSIEDIKKAYQIFPLLNNHNDSEFNLNRFALRKLNGNAVIVNNSNKGSYSTIFEKLQRAGLEDLLDEFKFNYTGDETTHFFNFSWEGSEYFDGKTYDGYKNNIEEAERISEQTEILVVIGYSFPIFNRAIDNRLLSKMRKLRKVYIQDKSPDQIANTMRSAFKILQQKQTISPKLLISEVNYPNEYLVDITLVNNTDQFFIPYELDLNN